MSKIIQTTNKDTKVNETKEDFSEYLVDILNKGALSLMISIGHRTGLFDSLSKLPRSTVKEIADEAGLSERYVNEWLGAMVVGKIVEYDIIENKFSLTKQKAEYLTSNNCIYNFSASMQWIPVLAQVEDEIVKCFKNGGGVPYSSYKRFHEVMAEDSNQTVVKNMIGQILPLVPGLYDKLEKGIKVLDIGCGIGNAINLMANKFPNSVFYGYDLSETAIESARQKSSKLGNSNTIFQVQDICNTTFNEKFDLITAFDAIHDQPKPLLVLKNINKSLDKNGIFLMQDILASSSLKDNVAHPVGSFLYTISCIHCTSVSLSQNGDGLGAMWGKEKAIEMLNEAGFTNIEVKTLPDDFQNYYYIALKN